LDSSSSVYLVAGSRLLRETLARLLTRRGGLNVCGVSPSLPDTASAIIAMHPEVLILDAVSARLLDYSFISQIVTQSPQTKVVLIDMDNDSELFL
jgi:chemotaxis response regulator CheB